MAWAVYLLACSDGSYYTGITNHLEHRLKLHNAGRASRYTRGRLPVRLVASKEVSSKSEALREEARIKRLPRGKKPEAFLSC